MNNIHIPYNITGSILTNMTKNLKNMLDDKCLLIFIIKYSNIHPETLLTWFVKQQRQQALVLYTTMKSPETCKISDKVFVLLCKIAIKNNNTSILKHLISKYKTHLSNNDYIFKIIIDLVITVYLKKKCVKWIRFLRCFITSIDYVINTTLFIKVLQKDKTKKLVNFLLHNGCFDNIINDIIYNEDELLKLEILSYIIIYNHLNILEYIIINGYELTECNVMVGILSSNLKMIKYIIKCFKPRLYTKGFRRMMLLAASKRDDENVYKFIYRRLK